jgi:hypothetical protein
VELAEDIAEQIEPEYRDDPMLKESKDLPAFIKRAVETKKMVGSSIQLPKKEDGPDIWHEKVYSKLGVPKTPDEYKIERGDSAEWDEDLEKSVRAVAHKHGLRPEGLQELVSAYNSHMGGKMNAMMVPTEKIVAELKKDWGNDYDAKVSQAKELVRKYDAVDPGFSEWLDNSMFIENGKDGRKVYPGSSSPRLAKMLAHFAPNFTEDFASNAGRGASGEGAEAIEFEIKDIRTNKDNPKYKLLMAGDKQTEEYLNGLYQKLHNLKGE